MVLGLVAAGALMALFYWTIWCGEPRYKGRTLTHWLVNAIISFGFPQVAAHSRGAPFVFFSAMMLLMFFVVLLYYPETKGITLEDMQRKLGIA